MKPGAIVRDFLRGSVRRMICDVMAAEVTELCGPKHHPGNSDCFRLGTSLGRVLVDGEREELVRPRVRRTGSSGGSREVPYSVPQVWISVSRKPRPHPPIFKKGLARGHF